MSYGEELSGLYGIFGAVQHPSKLKYSLLRIKVFDIARATLFSLSN
jgi:hypothetical protein